VDRLVRMCILPWRWKRHPPLHTYIRTGARNGFAGRPASAMWSSFGWSSYSWPSCGSGPAPPGHRCCQTARHPPRLAI
jgi:hypothetical protein